MEHLKHDIRKAAMRAATSWWIADGKLPGAHVEVLNSLVEGIEKLKLYSVADEFRNAFIEQIIYMQEEAEKK